MAMVHLIEDEFVSLNMGTAGYGYVLKSEVIAIVPANPNECRIALRSLSLGGTTVSWLLVSEAAGSVHRKVISASSNRQEPADAG